MYPQALQAPNDDVISGFRLYNVILLPALNVFGEIGLEDMQASLIDGTYCAQMWGFSCIINKYNFIEDIYCSYSSGF